MKQFIDAQTLIGVLDSGNTCTQLTNDIETVKEHLDLPIYQGKPEISV